MSTTKTQLMTINTTPTAPDTLNSEPLELVEDFTYPGNLIRKDNGQKHQTRPGENPLCFCHTSEHLDVQAVCHENKDKILQQ